MQVGSLVKYRKCGTLGVIIRKREVDHPIPEERFLSTKIMLEIAWLDGHVSDCPPRRVEVVCK
tara:strand:- start:3549 stop:3737 length:189 start_codon:yes stop_codon:yes gene_type:complete